MTREELDAATDEQLNEMAAKVMGWVRRTYCHPDPQRLYDKGWQAFHKWATDSSNKACSDANLGREFGDELRRIASTPLGAAALKAAFAEGWRSTGPLRHEAAYRLFANAVREVNQETSNGR